MTDEELDFFHQVAEREPPQQRVRELWVVGGRRGGKDSIASLIITYIAAMFDGKRRTIGGVTLPALRRGPMCGRGVEAASLCPKNPATSAIATSTTPSSWASADGSQLAGAT
jgi:hypothetical protein